MILTLGVIITLLLVFIAWHTYCIFSILITMDTRLETLVKYHSAIRDDANFFLKDMIQKTIDESEAKLRGKK